jgi:hypothetical protein
MIRLPDSLSTWGTADFRLALKRELETLGPAGLPLQQGLSASSYALDDPVTVVVMGADDDAQAIRARVGVFYSGIIAGCSCADDPTPVEAQNEYCELEISIDKTTAAARIDLAAD